MTKIEFEIIEGKFHDGLGTYAELFLANELISLTKISQPFFELSPSWSKMISASNSLSESDPRRNVFHRTYAKATVKSRGH